MNSSRMSFDVLTDPTAPPSAGPVAEDDDPLQHIARTGRLFSTLTARGLRDRVNISLRGPLFSRRETLHFERLLTARGLRRA